MQLFDSKQAPNPRRVRIFMAEKGITCDTVQVDIMSGENIDEAFLAINPRGVLPTLVLDDGTVIDETVAICRYFEETQPEPALMGTDPTSKAHIESRQRHMEFDGLMGAADAFRNSFPGFSTRGLAGNVGTVDAIPELAARGKESVARYYQALNTHLGENQFVAGSEFSIADITALCVVDFASTASRVPVPDDCTHLKRWHGEVSGRPSAQA